MGFYEQALKEIKAGPQGIGNVRICQQDYTVYELNQFIFFYRSGFEENLTGFKIHISVDAADVDRASNIIGMCVEKSQLGSFKIVAPNSLQKFSNPNETQAGKIFTCYIDQDKMNPQEWNQFVNNVEYYLRKEVIKQGPSLIMGGDQLIKGSQYMGTRQSYYVMKRSDGSLKRAGEIPRNIPLPKGFPDYGALLDVTPALNELSKNNSYSIMNCFEDSETHGKSISVLDTPNMSKSHVYR